MTEPFELVREYKFDAAHQLTYLPADHPCRQLHGHTYFVKILLVGDLDDNGWVMDFSEVDQYVKPLIAQLDHKFLNEVTGLEISTAEHICKWLYERLSIPRVKLWQVRIREGSRSECRYPHRPR